MTKLIYIASDHAGFSAKEKLIIYLEEQGYKVDDLGTSNEERVDYPIFAAKLAQKVAWASDGQGILICGSGIGVSMVANRFRGIRAALCKNAVESRLAKQHNNANVLCMDGRLSDEHSREDIVRGWLEASFEGGRHQDRIDMFTDVGIDSLEGILNE